ncbi:MAG: amino acid ABC transporter substrate-binding protein [Ruminococcaceae bacterium]|nr:amino acid ABC transporter substrate-binding protein [Oscillospiraceae bacterium]
MKKKLLAILLAAAMLLALCSCAAKEAEAPAEEAPASEAPAAESTGNVLKIGALLNTTGWFAAIDYNNQIEMETLCKFYNDQGGIDIGGTKYTLELVVEDGGSDAEGIRSAAQRLVDAGIDYVLETNDFWVEGAIDIFEQAGVMNIMAQNNMNHGVINADTQYSYSFSNACTSQYYAAMQVVKENYPEVKKVVYACDDNGVNDEQAALVKSGCEAFGLEYVDAPVVYDGETTDFAAIAMKIIASGADCVTGNGTPDNIASIIKEIRAAGSDLIYAAPITMGPGVFVAGSGINDLSGAFTFGSDIATPENNTDDFNTIYKMFVEIHGEDAATGWNGAGLDNFYTLLKIMQGAGSIDVEAVRSYYDTMESVETLFGTGVKGGMETFGNEHVITHPNHAMKVEGGQISYMGTYECVCP